jgi:hypothetical protein
MFIPEKKPYVLPEQKKESRWWILCLAIAVMAIDVAYSNADCLTGDVALGVALITGTIALRLSIK